MNLPILVRATPHAAESHMFAIPLDGADRVAAVDVPLMDGLDIGVFDEGNSFANGTSTGGAGDVPGNARARCDAQDLTPKHLG